MHTLLTVGPSGADVYQHGPIRKGRPIIYGTYPAGGAYLRLGDYIWEGESLWGFVSKVVFEGSSRRPAQIEFACV